MFQTSYFAKAGTLPTAISIARSAPPFFRGATYRPLTPPRDLLAAFKAGRVTPEEYTARYTAEVLDRRDAGTVASDLRDLAGPNAVLLCWEKPGTFCHRHLVAAWLREHGIDTEEMA